MRKVAVCVLLALVGCDGSGRGDADGPIDASPVDASPVDESRVPFTTTGTTPAGSLDDVRYLGVNFSSGFCTAFYVDLYRTNLRGEYPVLDVVIPISSEPPTGTITVTARVFEDYETVDASFEVARVDLPPAVPRIAGRLTAKTDDWNFDFTLDAVAVRYVCF